MRVVIKSGLCLKVLSGFLGLVSLLMLLPGAGVVCGANSFSDRLVAAGLDNPSLALDGNQATIAYQQAISEFDRVEEMLDRIAEILVIAAEELNDDARVVIRQFFDDGQILEVAAPASNGGAFLRQELSAEAFRERLDFHPLTRGPLIVAGLCEPGQGENCANCPDCACYPGEICDPGNPAANARGCVVITPPANAHLEGDQYVCDEGYEWNAALTDCLPRVTCPEHAFRFQQECHCEAGYAWNADHTACLRIHSLYYPHVACIDGWQTEICLINPSATETLHGSIKYFSNSGILLEPERVLALAPHARHQFTLTAASPGAEDLGYIVFASLSETMCGYLKFYLNGKYRVAIPASREKLGDDNLYVSHIASDSIWWTGISLLNTSSVSKRVTFTFDDGRERSLALAGNQHRAFPVAELFDSEKQPDIHSAEITQAAGVVGLQLFGGGNQLSGILLKDATAPSLYFPHLVSDDFWWTGVVAYNPRQSSCSLRITPYAEDGEQLTEQTFILGSHEKYLGTLSSLDLPERSAWFKLETDVGITGFELFGTNDGNLLAGYTGVGIAARQAIFPKLEDDGWTGIAFANISSVPANIDLTFYNDAGVAVANGSLLVGGCAKVMGSAENLLRVDTSGATYMDYSSDQEVVGFQLNGSSDNMMLDALPGLWR